MKTEIEIQRELREVRKLLKAAREHDPDGTNTEMMWGAQQALIWMLQGGRAPSEVERIIIEVANEMDAREQK